MNKYQVQQHLMQKRSLSSLVDSLHKKNMDYRILKGIPLNQLLYGNKLIRFSSDIDILIHPRDIKAVHNELSSQGYQLKSSATILDLLCKEGFLIRYMDQLSYWHPEKNMLIEVQWHTASMNCKGFTLKDFKQYDEMDIHHQKIKVLTPEQNFHYLCQHAAKHRWERRQWLNDLASFQKTVAYGWNDVISLAKTSDTIRPLLETSYLLKKYHGIDLKPVPHTLLDKLSAKFRLYFIRFQKPHKYTTLVFTLFLLPRLTQKKHYIIRTLLLRRKSLQQLDVLDNSASFNMIWRSLLKCMGVF